MAALVIYALSAFPFISYLHESITTDLQLHFFYTKHKVIVIRSIVLLGICLIVSAEFSPIFAQSSSSNPIMVIRCRNIDSFLDNDDKESQNFSKVARTCPDGYTATLDGGCVPSCPPRTIGSVTYTYEYNPETSLCEEVGCDPMTSADCESYCHANIFSKLGCEPCLNDNAGSSTDDYFADGGICYKTCFDGDVTFDIPNVGCATPNASGNVLVELCFSSADATSPLQDGQFVPITDIQNCLDISGAAYINEYDGLVLSTNQNLGFGPAMGGKICVAFYADPDAPIVVNLANQLTPLEVPEVCDVVPTMGQWALMILALLLSSIGLVFIAKRQMAHPAM